MIARWLVTSGALFTLAGCAAPKPYDPSPDVTCIVVFSQEPTGQRLPILAYFFGRLDSQGRSAAVADLSPAILVALEQGSADRERARCIKEFGKLEAQLRAAAA